MIEKLNWASMVEEAIARRNIAGMTQRDLAAATGLSLPTINKFEQGRTDITLTHVLTILGFLGLSQ